MLGQERVERRTQSTCLFDFFQLLSNPYLALTVLLRVAPNGKFDKTSDPPYAYIHTKNRIPLIFFGSAAKEGKSAHAAV
jgi:hypothetical protein